MTNETHDPHLTSWLPSANGPDTDFPIQNLPFGVFKRRGDERPARIGVAIGDQILDIAGCIDEEPLQGSSLNRLMAQGQSYSSRLRLELSRLLRSDNPGAERVRRWLVPMSESEMILPAEIGDYTDFYASIHHATNVGKLLRPETPLLPNYKHVPIAYHGRSSSIVASGAAFRRPYGQIRTDPAPDAVPRFGLSHALDYELEIGLFIGAGNPLGEPISIAAADSHIFGVCLVNDWSARDIQKWEYQPLGPFLGKSFVTTISPWIVTREALEPFRTPAFQRAAGDPQPLPYLDDAGNRARGGLEMSIELLLRTAAMRRDGIDPATLSRTNTCNLYWTPAQMIAHHTSNGCNLRPGDLLGSGTISSPEKTGWGSLLELSRQGKEPIALGNGEERRFLEDGDEVIMRAYCEHPGFARIGFGECRSTILPAI